MVPRLIVQRYNLFWDPTTIGDLPDKIIRVVAGAKRESCFDLLIVSNQVHVCGAEQKVIVLADSAEVAVESIQTGKVNGCLSLLPTAHICLNNYLLGCVCRLQILLLVDKCV